ncbi:MAG TPA: HNH endonuclease signature motif containing protein [Acidimicrobiia bacterium]|nr:HNH endonuclease signature motif containing protein [Acidimicrobiia bacterium]
MVSNGTTRRRPGTKLKRQVQANTPVCVFPGSRIPSLNCDLDHNQPWAQHGPTSKDNLGPLCRHHHVIRHHGWTIHQLQPGSYQLTSPLGHNYTSQPRAP